MSIEAKAGDLIPLTFEVVVDIHAVGFVLPGTTMTLRRLGVIWSSE